MSKRKQTTKRTILVTGGSSGIGKALKEHYLSLGDEVIDISQTGEGYTCDVTDRKALEEVFKDIQNKYTKIDIVIPCAGFGLSGAVELIPHEKVWREFEVNVLGVVNTLQLAIPLMQNEGKIIMISSATALFALPFRAYYCSSKAAVSMLSDCLRMELCRTKIQVTAICPCDIKTEFTKNRVKNFDTNERYKDAITLSAQKIDSAQDKRMSLEKATKIFVKIINKKRLKPQYVMGARNKTLYFVSRLVPKSWTLAVLKKLFYIEKAG